MKEPQPATDLTDLRPAPKVSTATRLFVGLSVLCVVVLGIVLSRGGGDATSAASPAPGDVATIEGCQEWFDAPTGDRANLRFIAAAMEDAGVAGAMDNYIDVLGLYTGRDTNGSAPPSEQETVAAGVAVTVECNGVANRNGHEYR